MTTKLKFLVAAIALAGGGVFAAWQSAGRGAAPPASPSAEAAPTISRVAVTPIPSRAIPGRGVADREVTIEGAGFFGTSFGPYVRFDGRDAVAVVMDPNDLAHRITAYAPPELHGRVEVVVENPDGQSVRVFAAF